MLKKLTFLVGVLLLFILFLFASPTDYTVDGNMVAYYYFEDAPGIDQSGTGDNHVDDAAADPTGDEADFKQGAQSADFELGSTQYLQCDTASLTADFPGKAASDSFTIVVWVKPEEHDSTRYNICGVINDNSWRIQIGSDDKLQSKFYYSDGGGGDVGANANTALVDGTWYHAAYVIDGTANKIYIYRDGVEDTGGGVAFDHTLVSGTGAFRIGNELASYHFDGKMDELAIFDRALNITEINEIMDDGLAGAEAEVEDAMFFGFNFLALCLLTVIVRRKK